MASRILHTKMVTLDKRTSRFNTPSMVFKKRPGKHQKAYAQNTKPHVCADKRVAILVATVSATSHSMVNRTDVYRVKVTNLQNFQEKERYSSNEISGTILTSTH